MKAILPTERERKKIKKGNLELINKYYVENYEFICMVARSYCRKRDIKASTRLWEDMAQECYLYFQKFELSSAPSFIRSITDICVYAFWGNEKIYSQVRSGRTEILTILDEPTGRYRRGGEMPTFGETLEADFDIMKYIEPPKSYTEEVKEIALSYLYPRQKEAFEYFYYTDMTAREVAAEMGIGMQGAQSLKTAARYKLIKNRELIREQLLDLGLNEYGHEIIN